MLIEILLLNSRPCSTHEIRVSRARGPLSASVVLLTHRRENQNQNVMFVIAGGLEDDYLFLIFGGLGRGVKKLRAQKRNI